MNTNIIRFCLLLFRCTNCKKKLLGPEVHQHLNQIPPCKKSISTVKRAKNTTKTTTRLRVPCSKCKEKFTVEALKYHVCSDVNPRLLKLVFILFQLNIDFSKVFLLLQV